MTELARETRVRIESIQVEGRHRREFGDVEALAKDIDANGLIHAIALTTDNRLIAGERRLRALRLLGHETVPVRYLEHITDAADVLRAERSENVQRKDMLPSELSSLGSSLEELERPKAAERRTAELKQNQGDRQRTGTPTVEPAGKTSAVVADALGVSASTYERTRAVHKAATDESLPEPERARAQKAMEEMDRTNTVTPVYNRWKSGDTFDPEPQLEPEPEDVPTTSAKGGKRTANRKPLPDAFQKAAWDLVKVVERLERLALDDRFPRNAEQVARMVRHDLLRAGDLLAAVVDRVPNLNKESTE